MVRSEKAGLGIQPDSLIIGFKAALSEFALAVKQGGSDRSKMVADYTDELRAVWESWAKETAPKIAAEKDEAKRKALIIAALAALLRRLKVAGRQGLENAFDIALDGEIPNADAVGHLDELIETQDEYLEGTVADLGRKIEAGLQEPGFEFIPDLLEELFASLAWRTRLYGGWLWAALAWGAAAMVAARYGEVPIVRLLDPQAEHCSTCPPKEGEYANWDEMIAVCGGVPGDMSDECGTSCRCQLYARVGDALLPILEV